MAGSACSLLISRHTCEELRAEPGATLTLILWASLNGLRKVLAYCISGYRTNIGLEGKGVTLESDLETQ